MAQTAGVKYGTGGIYGSCNAVVSTACTTWSGTWNASYGTCTKGSTYYTPVTCLIGTVDPCPTSDSVAVDWSVNSLDLATVSFIFGGSLLLWVVGLGLGLLIAQVRKTRVP